MSEAPTDQPDEAAGTRDRRDDGRPEQARPRDRTGRPLPYGTTGVPLTEEHDPASVEEALELGRWLWDADRYFEAHECLEHVWHAAPVEEADLWQGVIQIAVAGVHLQRGNTAGADALLERAAGRLAAYPDGHRGVAVTEAVRRCRDLRAALAAGNGAPTSVGSFPQTSTGVWFAGTTAATAPSTEPTPLPDEPSWVAAGRPRGARLRDRP